VHGPSRHHLKLAEPVCPVLFLFAPAGQNTCGGHHQALVTGDSNKPQNVPLVETVLLEQRTHINNNSIRAKVSMLPLQTHLWIRDKILHLLHSRTCLVQCSFAEAAQSTLLDHKAHAKYSP